MNNIYRVTRTLPDGTHDEWDYKSNFGASEAINRIVRSLKYVAPGKKIALTVERKEAP